MRFTDKFKDYELIDASNGERLERWKDIILIRPDPQIIWESERTNPLWNQAHARYHRSEKGGGYWESYKPVPDVWSVEFENLKFNLKPMGFKHTGLFPEQAVNWALMSDLIKAENREIKVLNLFGYTGAASLACAAAGAQVTHVDASKGMVTWGKENAKISGLADKPIRWIVDDCVKFAQREIRRGNKYDGIVMDPPSYGRGPSGEVWKLEAQLAGLLDLTAQLMSDNPLFLLLNSYTGGVSPTILNFMVKERFGGNAESSEIGLKVTDKNLVLPCGNTTVWQATPTIDN